MQSGATERYSRPFQSLRTRGLGRLVDHFLQRLNAAMRTFLLAGFALNIIFSPLKGVDAFASLVAGFFTTFIFSSPGIVNTPWPRKPS